MQILLPLGREQPVLERKAGFPEASSCHEDSTQPAVNPGTRLQAESGTGAAQGTATQEPAHRSRPTGAVPRSHSTGATPREPFHGSRPTEAAPREPPHENLPTGAVPRKPPHGSRPTRTFPRELPLWSHHEVWTWKLNTRLLGNKKTDTLDSSKLKLFGTKGHFHGSTR